MFFDYTHSVTGVEWNLLKNITELTDLFDGESGQAGIFQGLSYPFVHMHEDVLDGCYQQEFGYSSAFLPQEFYKRKICKARASQICANNETGCDPSLISPVYAGKDNLFFPGDYGVDVQGLITCFHSLGGEELDSRCTNSSDPYYL